jgi:hypothetical protein
MLQRELFISRDEDYWNPQHKIIDYGVPPPKRTKVIDYGHGGTKSSDNSSSSSIYNASLPRVKEQPVMSSSINKIPNFSRFGEHTDSRYVLFVATVLVDDWAECVGSYIFFGEDVPGDTEFYLVFYRAFSSLTSHSIKLSRIYTIYFVDLVK